MRYGSKVEAKTPRNFIQHRIDSDIKSGKTPKVITRFPPEPNGYLHIGHAKSICLNFGTALEYDGTCHLRMDDTNPIKEDIEYQDAIVEDIRWLGFDWKENFFHASDYFEKIYLLAEKLIQKDKAYVCSMSPEEIRKARGTLTEPGQASPGRDLSTEENLSLIHI